MTWTDLVLVWFCISGSWSILSGSLWFFACWQFLLSILLSNVRKKSGGDTVIKEYWLLFWCERKYDLTTYLQFYFLAAKNFSQDEDVNYQTYLYYTTIGSIGRGKQIHKISLFRFYFYERIKWKFFFWRWYLLTKLWVIEYFQWILSIKSRFEDHLKEILLIN